MEMNDLSCAQFLAQLASKAPTPGGGGTAALVGAAGVALGNMVGCLTTGKKKYAAVGVYDASGDGHWNELTALADETVRDWSAAAERMKI